MKITGRLFCLLMCFLMLLPALVSCGGDEGGESRLANEFTVKFGDTLVTATQANCAPAKNKVTVYTKDYMVDGQHTFNVSGVPDNCVAAAVTVSEGKDGRVYTVVDKKSSGIDKMTIPVNGFLLVMPSVVISVDKITKTAEVNGFDKLVTNLEDVSGATLSPENTKNSAVRKINFYNPVIGLDFDKIYFVDKDYKDDKDAPRGSVYVELDHLGGTSYEILSVKSTAHLAPPEEGDAALFFTGGFNTSYANQLLKVGVGMQIENIKKANSYSEKANVGYDGGFFEFDSAFMNNEKIEADGVYLYSEEFSSRVTPATDKSRVDVVISDGIVVYTAEKNARSLIPEKGGYVLSFVGDDAVAKADFEVGDAFTHGLFEVTRNTVDFAKADYSAYTIGIDAVNEVRGEDKLILYRYSASTNTNAYGYEIAVDADGYMIAESYGGNMKIPEGGFVLSAHGKQQTVLEPTYTNGIKVILSDDSKSVTLVRTPITKINNAKYSLSFISDKLDSAKKAFLNLDFKYLDEEITSIAGKIDEMEAAFDEFDFEKAFDLANSVVKACQSTEYGMIESGGAENRAIWHRPSVKSEEEVKKVIETVKELNINAIYLETWYEGYCIGNKVEAGGYDLARNHDFDILESYIRNAHENGIEIHAWVQNFFVGYYYEGGSSYYNPVFAGKDFEGKYAVDRGGNDRFYYTANGNYWYFLNPNDKYCRDLVLEIYKEIITKYDIDGLHLDYVRFPELNLIGNEAYDFGYNQDIIDGFKKATGIKTDPAKLKAGTAEHDKWIQYRCDIITSFVGEVYSMVKSTDPDIWLSAALYPDLTFARTEIMQDVRTFAKNGYFDEIFSMSYGVDNAYVIGTVSEYVNAINKNAFYSAGLSGFTDTPAYNFAYQIPEVTENGADGVSVFSYEYLKNYTSVMKKGGFRNPSTQVNRLNETALAQMEWIKQKADNLASVFAELDADDLAFVKSKCDEMIAICDDIDLKSATKAQKTAWLNKALSQIKSAKTAITSKLGAGDETGAFITEFESLEYWLTLSLKRLSK